MLRKFFGVFLIVSMGASPVFGALFHDVRAVKKANQFYENGDYDNAISLYNSSAKRGKPLAEVQNNLGLCYVQKNESDKAEKAFLSAQSGLQGKYKSEAMYNLGNGYLYAKQWDKAIDAYQGSLRLNPKDRDAKKNLEIALRMAKMEKKKDKDKQDKKDQKKDVKNKNDQQPQNQQGKNDQKKGGQNQQQSGHNEQDKKIAAQQLKFLDQREKDARKRYRRQVVKESSVEKDW